MKQSVPKFTTMKRSKLRTELITDVDTRSFGEACLRDGPLENLWGGEGERAKYKKNIRAREN